MPSIDWRRLLDAHLRTAKRPLVCVLGPTASGKTKFSIDLCMEYGGEVINADSRQLYRGFDIGTAKVTAAEAKGVPHHLIDVLDARQPVNIGWYQEQATAAIDDVLAREKLPVLVGGSMLYVSAIIDGLQPLPAVDPALRKRLEGEFAKPGGPDALHRRLQEIDPDGALSIDKRNGVHLVRALELAETGGPIARQKRKRDCPYDVLIFAMDWPREQLQSRINQRTAKLFAEGWVEEVEALITAGVPMDAPAMISQGYREIAGRLQREQTKQREQMQSSKDTFVPFEAFAPFVPSIKTDKQLCDEISAKTRRYAKRQLTWWRGDDRIVWLTPDD